MARVSISVPDSGEKSYKVTPHRAITLGRDPGNDIVLRDAKVSRHHARIVYERGFYVLHDLSSSNGTFVNGRRIKVAPLTDHAEFRLGNCVGRFLEEPDDLRGRDSEDLPVEKKTVPGKVELATAPHPLIQGQNEPGEESAPADEDKKKSEEKSAVETGLRYSIELRSPEREVAQVRDENESPLFFFRSPVTLVGFVARLVAAMMTLSGAAVALFLFTNRQSFPGLTTIVLTIAFIFAILMLVPRQQILLYSDAALSSIAMTLVQETRFSFPTLRFTLRKADGSVIGGFQKNLASNFGLRRWWILDRPGNERLGYAREESLGRALVRLIVATVRTNFGIYLHDDRQIGMINRRSALADRFQLHLWSDPSHLFDRRLAIGLAVLIDSVEGR